MLPPLPVAESLAAPLAEHFFIAGIESSSLLDRKDATTTSTLSAEIPSSPTRRGERQSRTGGAGLRPVSPCGTNKRQSISSVMGTEQISRQGKRKSTILDHIDPSSVGCLSEEDFDAALRRFAAERDTVLKEIEEQQGKDDRPRTRPPSQKTSSPLSPHRRDKSLGSLRRRLSGINPLTRSSTSTRRTSNRLSQRVSNYNSVIPCPRAIQQDAQAHPLRQAYEPVLLDRYPHQEMSEECRGRKPFPDYVPMFVFPSDVTIVAADERPKSRYHAWTMTAGKTINHGSREIHY